MILLLETLLKKFTHHLYMLKGIHKYLEVSNQLYHVNNMFDSSAKR